MLTLNQLKNKLVEFFNAHRQLNTVCYGDDFDFNAERSLVYPVCNIEYTDSIMADKFTTHNYLITLSDLYDPNIKGHSDEIQSDMMGIGEDFFRWASESYDFEFIKSVRTKKFVDDADDRTSGISFNVQISVVRGTGVCAIPLQD